MKNLFIPFKFFVNLLILSLVAAILDKGGSLSKLLLNTFNLLESSTKIESSTISLTLILSNLLLLSYVLWLIIKFRKVIYSLKTDSIFSEKNSRIFKTVGRGLIFYSIGIFIIRVIENTLGDVVVGESVAYNFGRNIGATLSDRIPLLVIAFFLLIVAQLINEGYQLKNENDLTI
tara:strand:- start:45 stop:569 length:525 start_codon:yes stop_codon:yes gene_type:complete